MDPEPGWLCSSRVSLVPVWGGRVPLLNQPSLSMFYPEKIRFVLDMCYESIKCIYCPDYV